MIVTFIGHRKLQNNCDFRIQLKEIILALIDHRNADMFLFGSRSDFDDLCLEIVTEIKKERPFIQRIYVRAKSQTVQQTVNHPFVFNFTQHGDNNTQIGHIEHYHADKKED